MTNYTNKHGIALPMAVWLTRDTYDYVKDPNYISATQFSKPMRELVLSAQHDIEPTIDIASQIPSRLGTTIHDGIEQAWLNDPHTAMLALGYPESVVNRILVNPNKADIQDDSICIYLEQRSIREFNGFKIGGKFDFVMEGKVQDFKTTSTYAYMLGSSDQKHLLQGSIYRWLNPELITQETMTIHYLFTDWSKGSYVQQKDKGYPELRVAQKELPLLSLEETEEYIRKRLDTFTHLKTFSQGELPQCTPEELWQGESVFKYYKKAGAARSTKNFTSLSEANERLFNDGSVGQVVEVKGKITYCKFCSAADVCTQKDKYIEEGTLVFED